VEKKKEMMEILRKCDAFDGGAFVGTGHEATSLWVDKYQPRSYKDLLSDEVTIVVLFVCPCGLIFGFTF
jgi:hypothetical protein